MHLENRGRQDLVEPRVRLGLPDLPALLDPLELADQGLRAQLVRKAQGR